jgi:lichenan operon transcriptional antiterminator
MFSSLRLDHMFTIISGNEYTTAEEMMDKFHVTDRTIRTDIKTLNSELKKYDCEVILKRKMGYHLCINDEKKYRDLINKIKNTPEEVSINSMDDRIKYILKELLYSDDYIILDDLADKVFVTRNTLQNYIKPIKDILEKYNLMYISKPNIGVKIFGNEKDKRECLVNEILNKETPSYVISFSKQEQTLFEGIDLYELQEIVTNILNKYDIETNDYDRKNLVIHFALMLSRVKAENYIPYNPDNPIPNDVKDIINQICKKIETKFDVQITKGEKQYIYLHIVSNTHIQIGEVNPIQLENKITELLNVIYQEYNFDLRYDEILKKDLFNHFKSIFSTKDIYLNKKNPLLNTIKSNFPLPFEITLTSTKKVFTEELSEDEIGYISLHIGASIERCFTGKYEKKKVLLVCGSGIATTRMLEARLQSYFNNKIIIMNKISYAQFKHYDYSNIDFVISTIPIESDEIPIEVVDFALKNQDIEKISKRLSTMEIQTNSIIKFFDNQLFVHRNKVKSKKEILKQLGKLLENKAIVDEHYFESVLERESMANTNMNEVFAIPHPMQPCSNETKVCVAILDEPIEWNDNHESVQIIFMISIKVGEQQDIEHLYDLFIEIVNNKKLQQDIIHSKTYEQFIAVISNVMNKK